MEVNRLRQAIPVTRKVIYLNTGWSGPSPTTVTARVKRWLDFEAREGPTAPRVLKAHHQAEDDARQAVARLIGASPDEIALVQNTTEGINIVLNGMTWRPGDEVVTTNLEHSSGIIPCYSLSRRRRIRVRIVDLAGAQTPSDVLERLRMAMGPRTRLIVLSHIMYLNGMRLPIKEIQAMARESNVKVLVDAAQSVGQIPLHMKDLGCDFYSLPGHKWLLGPDGTGALYIRRELIPQIRPFKVGHHTAISYDFKGNWKPDTLSIKKFELTTTSSALWAGLTAAIDLIGEIGQIAIQNRIRTLSEMAVTRLSSLPRVLVTSPRHPQLASGLVTFSVQDAAPQQVVAHLWKKGQVVSRWVENPPGVRLSLHFFNTEEEIETVVDCLRELG
ncbi:MAG: aminotransferase class V-fold PLP-dependent enzyme [Dehalococcoidia bacterium]|nr:aminotransferase class V-fold PLP-dependent enzyme [Dehalococcoidia bacterium]